MKGLVTLIRLHKLKLTANQRRLNELRATAQGFVAKIEALDRMARAEAVSTDSTPETAYTLGGFVQASISRRATLRESLAGVEREMAPIRDEVAAAFRELKRYELIVAKRDARAALAVRRRDRQTENEVGMSMYRQKQAAAKS